MENKQRSILGEFNQVMVVRRLSLVEEQMSKTCTEYSVRSRDTIMPRLHSVPAQSNFSIANHSSRVAHCSNSRYLHSIMATDVTFETTMVMTSAKCNSGNWQLTTPRALSLWSFTMSMHRRSARFTLPVG